MKYVRYQHGEEELTDFAVAPEERENLARQSASQNTCADMRMRLLDVLLSTGPKGPEQICHA